MNNQHSIARSFNLIAASVLLLLLFGWLTAGRAAAQSAGLLPLPDMLIYGTVTNATGDPLDSGTIKALLNGQTIASAEIGAVNGTDYNFVLAAPSGMVKPGSTERGTGIALAGDALTFLVDDRPAYYQDPFTSLTVSELRIQSGMAGRGFVLNLSLPDAMRYLIGDVNANGARNAADAMLTLKYDIGLIIGVTTFPPGPNTVYLPLCDIVENGRCDSSDALRVLQCDVGLTTVVCPMTTIPAVRGANAVAQPAATPAVDAAPRAADGAAIGLQVAVAEDGATVDVSVLLTSAADRFGAAVFELQYDPAVLAPAACETDPGAVFSMVACNPGYAPGAVRFNAIAATGAADDAALATLRFQRIGDAAGQLPTFILTANDVIDVDGAGLAWSVESKDAPETSDVQMQHKLFLPSVASQFGQMALDFSPAAETTAIPEPTIAPTEEPLPTAEATPTFEPTEAPTLTPTEEPPPTAEATPTFEPTEAPTEAPTLAPTEEPPPTAEATPMFEPTEAPTEAPTLAPTEEPPPTAEATPTFEPTEAPTLAPTDEPSPTATTAPTLVPTEELSPTATIEVTPTPDEAVTSAETPTAELTALPAGESTPTAEPASPALPPPQSSFLLYLPAVSGGAITTTISADDAPAIDTPAVDDAMPAPEAEASQRVNVLVVVLPSTRQARSRVGYAVRRLPRRCTNRLDVGVV